MEKFVPYDKLSKKERRKIDAEKRNGWNGVNPAMRVEETERTKYKRKPKYPENYDE